MNFTTAIGKRSERQATEGELVASNWQAGRAYSHFYNLHSDALIGTVDRHNYFGGGSETRIDNATMLMLPGSGILSSGMQQVLDRPFMLSEWIHVTPNEWGVEGPAIIGAYGMGLQGWDVSFMFQNRDNAGFSKEIGRDNWEVTTPQILGVFPAVARQVVRGDVTESPLVAPNYVHVPSLDQQKLGFQDKVTQQYDVKAFETDKVPAAALAVARCGVQFTDSYRQTPEFDVTKFLRWWLLPVQYRAAAMETGFGRSSMASSLSTRRAPKGWWDLHRGSLAIWEMSRSSRSAVTVPSM